MFKRILFPTDFSSDRNQALHHALATLDADVDEVIVQHVVNNILRTARALGLAFRRP